MADWANIQHNGNSVGTLYFDGERMGFVPVVQTPDAVPGFAAVSNLIQAALLAPVTAEDSYFGILGSLDKRPEFSYEVGNGDTVPKPERDISGLVQHAVDSEDSPYYVMLNEDDEVLSLVQDTGTGILVRENGEWVEPTDENYPSDDEQDYWSKDVTENSVATYDKLVSSNKAPTINDLEVVAP